MMSASLILGIGIAFVFIILFWLTLLRRRATGWMGLPRPNPVAPTADGTERDASAVSEMIEKLVNEALVKAGLPAKKVDFATAHDGSLEIWVGEDRYTSVEAIPDPAIRKAMADAVTAFNKAKP
jgi:hypothetical protein